MSDRFKMASGSKVFDIQLSVLLFLNSAKLVPVTWRSDHRRVTRTLIFAVDVKL